MTTTRFDATTAACHVLTFKEGLLSAVAHDLRIRVERFSIEIDREGEALAIRATFDARSLRVDGVMRDGGLAPDVLGSSDRAKIERSIVEEVLHADAHPEIRFRSSRVIPGGGGHRVEGELELHGATRPIRFDVIRAGDALAAEASLHQPDFGVRPFTAMLGAIRIKPDVRVRVTVPLDPSSGSP